jgi:hypothetical protein
VNRETEHGSRDSGSAEECEVEDGCRDAHRCGSDTSCDGKLAKRVSWETVAKTLILTYP